MQLPVYTPQVQKTAGGDARIAVPHNIGAAGLLAAQGINALNKGVGAVNAVLFKQAADADKTTATAANNEYTQRLNDVLYNDKDGLLHTQMKGADGITSVFEEKEKQIRDEIAKKYKFNFNAGRQEFDNMAGRTYAQRMTNVQNHMYAESKKYRDVTFSNAIDNQARFAADNYADAAMVEDAMAGALANVDNYYAGQGTEVVEQQRRRIAGQIAQQVINRAYASGDINAAETFIERYGGYMDPAALSNYSKAVYQNRLRLITRDTADSLVSQYGNNLAAIRDAIYNRGEGGSGYDGNKAVAWMKQQEASGANWGTNTCTKGVNAALQAGGGLPGNTWAPTNWDDAKKAGMAFRDKSQLRSGDIVYWWKPGSDKDADDTSHVGIYDAETGKVYQSGTSGFKAIDLNTYSITGFARPQGRGMTREQQDAMYEACVRKINQDKAIRNQQIDATFDDLDKKFMAMHDAGNVNYDDYMNMAMQFTDPEMRRKANAAAGYWWRLTAKPADGSGSGSGSGGSRGGLPIGAMQGLEETLMVNNFENKSDWSRLVLELNPNKSEYERLMNLYDDKKQGKGRFQYNWEGLKEWFKKDNRFPKDTEHVFWREARGYAVDEINRFREEKHREPTVEDVQRFLKDSLKTVGFGEIESGHFWKPNEKVSVRRGQLRAKGIEHTGRFGDDMIELDYGGNRREIINREQMRDMFGQETDTDDRYRY